MKQTLLLALLVGGVAMIAHWPSLDARALTFDDDEYLVRNPFMQNPSWHGLGRFWTEIARPSTVPGYYQPLAMTSLMIDAALGGRPADLRPFHRTSLALHAVNAILIFVVLSQLLNAPIAAAIAAMLFGVHPVAVESICWVGERKTLLATGLALLSISLYVRHAKTRRWPSYGLSLFFFILALAAKPSVMFLPFVLLILDAWPLRHLDGQALIEKLPYLLIAVSGAVVAYISQSNTYGVTLPIGDDAANPLALLAHNIAFYLCKALWPTTMSAYYPFPRPLDFSSGMVLAGAIAMPVLVVVAIVLRRKTPAIAAGLGIFTIALLPAIGLIGFHPVIAADRHLYFPIVGLLLPLAVLLDWLLGRRSFLLPVVATVAFVLLTRQTRLAIAHWRDTTSLFQYFVRNAPDSPAPHARLGAALLATKHADAAIAPLQRSLELRPAQPNTLRRLGEAQLLTGRAADAVKSLEAARALRPTSLSILRQLGYANLAVGDFESASKHFQAAFAQRPRDPELLAVLSRLKRELDAIATTQPASQPAPTTAPRN